MITIQKVLSVFFLSTCLLLTACSSDSLIEVKKEQGYFDLYQNPGAEISQAAQKIESIKLLHTGEDFPIRLALYDNGQFYYDVDNLGKGIGTWVYEKGGLRLTTKRKFFDMNFYVSAAQTEGEALVVKFFDSRGYNVFPLNFRNPQVNPNLEKLREFKDSVKDI